MLFSDFLDSHILKKHRPKEQQDEGKEEGLVGTMPTALGDNNDDIHDDDIHPSSPSPAAADHPIVYLAQHPLLQQIPQLGEDVREPEYCVLGEEGEVHAVNMWLGPAGTISPPHTDPYHNMLCQVVGRKYVRLYPQSATPAMYPEA